MRVIIIADRYVSFSIESVIVHDTIVVCDVEYESKHLSKISSPASLIYFIAKFELVISYASILASVFLASTIISYMIS